MKKTIIMLVWLALWASAPASAQQNGKTGNYRLTLEDCLEYATGNSYTRQSMELSVRSAQLTYDQSKLERLPNLSASASENFSHSKNSDGSWAGSYGLNAGMTLYNGGSISNTIIQNRLFAEETEVRSMQYDNSLAIDVMSSFFTILGYEELSRYQESLITESEAQVKDGALRLANDMILKSDYMLLEAQLAANRNSVEETRISLKNELLNLKGLLSMDLDYDLQIVVPDTTAFGSMTVIPELLYYMSRSTESMPDFQLLNYGVEIADMGLKLSRAAMLPTLSLSGGLGTGHSENFRNWGTQVGDRFSQSAGISLSIPIFSRNRNRTNIDKSRIALQQAELDRKQGELDIKQSLTQSYHNVESALNSYRMFTIREEAYRESLRVFREQFKAGLIRPVDLLQQENNYINVMYDYVQSKYGFMLRRKILDVFMGLEIKM